MITNNFHVAYETIDSLRGRSKGKTGVCALKIDIAKAYDMVNRAYLCKMITAFEFDSIWLKWMKMCFMEIEYKICVNGEQVVLLFLLGDYDREIIYLCICSYWCLKTYLFCFSTRSVND